MLIDMDVSAASVPPGLRALSFDNVWVRDLPGDPDPRNAVRQVQGALWSPVAPTPVAAPRVLACTRDVATDLGIDEVDIASDAFAQIFGGNAMLSGMQAFASNYGGHQFGHWAGQLGDGRAITLGEVLGVDGRRHELQLKGAGPTPYSRHADGRAVLRSSIREFLCSEAMHHLGIPTTRALCLIGTGEDVLRDMFYDGHPQGEPGAIVCRVAPSFVRFGHFELPSARGDVALLRRLADVCIARDFPHLSGDAERRYAEWFGEVCERTARMVAEWMRVGFVHGVMNTDNMSIQGLTIDYGPYGWIDDYDPDWTPNTTDAQGRRYRFGWQPRIAHWNLVRLAQALSPLFDDAAALQDGIDRYASAYAAADRDNAARKLGLAQCTDADIALIRDVHRLMHAAEIDMTLWFRALSAVDPQAPSLQPFEHVFYDPAKRRHHESELVDWLGRYAARLREEDLDAASRITRMHAANPKYVLRNWLAQQAIDRAHQGDMGEVHALQELLRHPYADQPGREAYAAKRPDWARDKAGCSMLSCSS